MFDEHPVYVPWYEQSPEGLDELTQIKRTVDQLNRRDGRREPGSGS
jgi:hypothetical protein